MPLFEPWSPDYIRKIADGLSQIESAGGKYLNHEPQTKGIHAGTTAGGAMGIMPITLKDQIKESQSLGMPIDPRVLALSQMSTGGITRNLNKDRNLDNATQEQLLRLLLHKKQGDEAEVVEAHRRGSYGASKTNDVQTMKDPYVRKYFNNLFDSLAQHPRELAQEPEKLM